MKLILLSLLMIFCLPAFSQNSDIVKKIERASQPEEKPDMRMIDPKLMKIKKPADPRPLRMYAVFKIQMPSENNNNSAQAKSEEDNSTATPTDKNENLETVKIKLFHNLVPNTVANFVGLAEGKKSFTLRDGKRHKRPFYDGLEFTKVIRGFIVQSGCPYNDSTGGPGYEIENEVNSNYTFNRPGLVSTVFRNGSQFFITLGKHEHLNNSDPKHIIFGEVIEGMDTIYEIGKIPVNRTDKPLKKVILKSVKIEREYK
ncbi:MAG: peptidylprolyl isomerase [Bdellovibrionales bacterium]|nr:peptidylprolyl isomerase [Bdellovibrionales bacterium]